MNLPAWLAATAAAVGAAILPACDAINLREFKPGVSTAAEVRARMGEPGAEFRNADGTVTWEYNRQPNGTECHMLTFGPDQVLLKIEQVLNEANFAKIHAGLDKDEVRRRLGRPGSKAVYERLREEVWEWRIAGTLPTEETYFHVHFDADSGLVKKTSRRVEQKG